MATSTQKNWCELTDSEKIDRMRLVIRGMMEITEGYENDLLKLKTHTHDSSGRLTIPLNHSEIGRPCENDEAIREGKVYF